MINKLLDKYGLTKDDIGMILFTQVRKKTIEKVMETLELPLEKTHMIMHKYGYTGSACVYMAYDDAFDEGKIEQIKGKVLIFLTSGVGFQQVATAFRVI